MSKAEEVLASSYEKLLEFALTHQGDPDTARIPQLEAERDAAKDRVEELAAALRTVTAERDGLKAQQAMDQTRFAQLQAELDKPRINPEWEDMDRFITAAVENFEHDPEKALKNLTRAHLALQGKEPVEEESA